MPRYHFYLVKGPEVLEDEDGLELTGDHLAVVADVRRALTGLRIDEPEVIAAWEGWSIEVRDAAGRPLANIPVAID